MNKGEGSILKRLRGSTAIGGAADLILGVETTGVGDAKTSKIESGKTRGGAEIEEVNINWLERGGRLNFSVRTNYVLTDSRSVSILQTLQDEGRRLSFSDLMARVKGFSGNAVMDALKNLMNERKINREIVNNKAYYVYVAPQETA
jgi:hypothetical protein